MAVRFDREKLPNYIFAGIIFVAAVLFIRYVAIAFWRFDFFKLSHLRGFMKYAFTGKIFLNGRYLSMLFVLPGLGMLACAAVAAAYERDLAKLSEYVKSKLLPEEKKEKEEKKEDAPAPPAKEEAKESAPQPQPAPAPTPARTAFLKPARTPANRHGSYNGARPAAREAARTEPAPSPMDESAEKEKLQAKIREVMERMKSKEGAGEAEPEKSERILSRASFDGAPQPAAGKTAMNFKSISEEENAFIERTLIDAGAKLLSEIRIGSTGIDYLAVAKDGINAIQVYTEPGNWMASEDAAVDGSPQWFSEEKSKLSPVARALAAKKDVETLISGKIDLPVKAYACIASASVINAFDIEEEWKKLGVAVVKLAPNSSLDSLETIAEAFPPGSRGEIDEATMQKLISILEAAELPE